MWFRLSSPKYKDNQEQEVQGVPTKPRRMLQGVPTKPRRCYETQCLLLES